MVTNEQKHVFITTDVATGLLEVLQETPGKQAKKYAKLLKKKLKEEKGKQVVQLSMATVASILRIIFMILVPEPLGHAIMMTLEKMF